MPKTNLLKTGLQLPIRQKSTWRDRVYVQNLRVPKIVVGLNSWNVVQPQDVHVNLEMATDFSIASENDDLNYSLNYAVISRDIGEKLNSKKFESLIEMGSFLSQHLLTQYKGIESMALTCDLPQGDIRCKNISVEISKDRDSEAKVLLLRNIEVLTLIGVFTFERLQKQYVTLDISVPLSSPESQNINYRSIIKDVWSYIEKTNFKTVESLVERTSQLLIQKHNLGTVTVKVIKLNAITDTDGVGVSCVRNAKDFDGVPPVVAHLEQEEQPRSASESTNISTFDLPVSVVERENYNNSIAYLAFGSNMNHKLDNIVVGLEELANVDGNVLLDCSSMFESEPMYFEDQDLFYNGIIKLETNLLPHDLLKLCKKIEYQILQRVKKFDNGPRTIDLDIVMYLDRKNEHVVLNTPDLIIPHPRMLERGFVMAPLCEVIPSNMKHPISTEPLKDHLKQLMESPSGLGLHKILPLKNNTSIKFNLPACSALEKAVKDDTKEKHSFPMYPMYVVNVTPDSFSDGNQGLIDYNAKLSEISAQVDKALTIYPEMEKIIVDIGGCSTRPNSVQPSKEEELARVAPLLELLNNDTKLRSKTVISLDTYRPQVARKMIHYLDIINDIGGDTLGETDSDADSLWKVVKDYPHVGYVLSHIRGDISTMSKLNNYSEHSNGESAKSMTEIIASELDYRLKECLEFGVKRWQIILDPGLGFAKVGTQNIQVLQKLHLFKQKFPNYPILLGPSRKKFLGAITNEPVAADRDVETMALVSKLALDGNCDIIRIHSLTDCVKTLKVIDALR
ncbi:hypothetical protein ACO0QE_002205 [Hanseniaspora vineae]